MYRQTHIPDTLGPVAITDALHLNMDAQYDKHHLLPDDPSGWVDTNGSTKSPAGFPVKEVRFYDYFIV